jgi:hypothetical protein
MSQKWILILEIMNPRQWNPCWKRREIDEIPGGNGRGRRGETRDVLGWTGINGEGLPTRKGLFSLREREREKRRVFFVGVEVNGYEDEGIDKLKTEKGDLSGSLWWSDRMSYRT